MRTSYSSLLRSMPMYQPQLNRTDFKSFVPAAGVYSCTAPRPRPPPPPPCAGAWAPAGPAPCACALDRDGRLIMSVAMIATHVHLSIFREAIMISRSRLVCRATRGDIQDGAVRPSNRLEESQWSPVPCRDELRGNWFAALE